MAHGAAPEQASAHAQALALRAVDDRLEHGEAGPESLTPIGGDGEPSVWASAAAATRRLAAITLPRLPERVMPIPHRLATLALAAISLGLLGCNPLIANDSGERWPPVSAASVVVQAPTPQSVRWIGHADFTTTGVVGDADAIAAARQVGADLVERSDRDLGQTLEWTSVPVHMNAWSGQMANAPVPVMREQCRCSARFFRSNSLGGAPTSAPGSTPPHEVPPVK
jgi:hypothetical protein